MLGIDAAHVVHKHAVHTVWSAAVRRRRSPLGAVYYNVAVPRLGYVTEVHYCRGAPAFGRGLHRLNVVVLKAPPPNLGAVMHGFIGQEARMVIPGLNDWSIALSLSSRAI